MEAPERKGGMNMESEKMKSEETGQPGVVEGGAAESPKDLFAWSQYLHDSQFFDIASLSPKGLQLSTPRDSPNTFPDLSAICPSPLFADHLKFLQSWSPRVTNVNLTSDHQPESTTTTTSVGVGVAIPPVSVPGVVPSDPPSVSDQFQKQIQSLDLSRVSNSEPGVSNSVTTSCDSEAPSSSSADVKRAAASTAESTGSGDEKSRSRKRKSAERDDEDLENVDDASEADETEESKDIANKKSRSKQQKPKGPKRLREPRYAIKTRTDVDIMEDGYKWRKYGQKPVKNSPHPRNYYRCTTPNCPVRKRVERSLEDPGLVVTSYEGTHTHPKVNQSKRTASGNFAPVEAAESLSESLNQLQNRQQAASASSAPPQLPQVPNLFPGFPTWPNSLMNRQMPPPTGALQDNVGLMLAYQIVRLQWELQAKIQQFISYNAQGGGFPGGGLPKVNPFMDPFGFQTMSMPDMSIFGGSSDSDPELKFPKVPEALSSGSGNLLARRAAQRTGSPLNPNLQTGNNAAKMQQLMAQMMAGLQQQAALEQQHQQEGNLGEPDQQPGH